MMKMFRLLVSQVKVPIKKKAPKYCTADNINNTHYTCKVILADSICTFYGIDRNDLIKIIKSKHLISKKKERNQ